MIFNIKDITPATFDMVRTAYEDGERNFTFVIDSYGGSLESAFRIYDLLRGDKDNQVFCTVEGNCISAATVILCAAPLEHRYATKNSAFLIHSPILNIHQDVNKNSIEQIKGDIDSAFDQLKSIYLERTSIGDQVDEYMNNEKTFFADSAKALGFIGNVREMYNRSNNTNFKHMLNIKNLIVSILSQLKNETYVTKDGKSFEALSLEVGAAVEGLEDGVFELEDGSVITVDKNVIIDYIPADAKPADENLENEEGAEDPEKKEAEKTDEQAAAVTETVEKVAEDVNEAANPEEIKEIVETAVSELKEEIINKYKPMCELIKACGGAKRLEALKNSKPQAKAFEAKASKKSSSLEDLMNRIRK